MKVTRLTTILIMLFFLFILVQLTCGAQNNVNKNRTDARNLEEIYGEVTLHFSITGKISLINLYYLSSTDLYYYLKSDNKLTLISSNSLSKDEKIYKDGGFYDSYGRYIYSILVYYNLDDSSKEIVIKFKEKPTSLKALFAYSNAEKITLENFVTDKLTSMELMFMKCYNLKEVNFGGISTSKVINFFGLFLLCKSLNQLDIYGWDTSNVEDMSYMFYYCSNLKQLNLSGWDISNVGDVSYMFYNCSGLLIFIFT